jgi:Proton-conducting membrane transporter
MQIEYISKRKFMIQSKFKWYHSDFMCPAIPMMKMELLQFLKWMRLIVVVSITTALASFGFIMRIGMGAVKLAYFHILRHALFKALLFKCIGNIIHCSGDIQDFKRLDS